MKACSVPRRKLLLGSERYRVATGFWDGLLEECPVADRQGLESRDGYAKLHVQIVQVITCQRYISASFRVTIVVCGRLYAISNSPYDTFHLATLSSPNPGACHISWCFISVMVPSVVPFQRVFPFAINFEVTVAQFISFAIPFKRVFPFAIPKKSSLKSYPSWYYSNEFFRSLTIPKRSSLK